MAASRGEVGLAKPDLASAALEIENSFFGEVTLEERRPWPGLVGRP